MCYSVYYRCQQTKGKTMAKKTHSEVRKEKDAEVQKSHKENLRVALKEAHEDHRHALGMVFKSAITNGTVFAGLIAFYFTLLGSEKEQISNLKESVAAVGLITVVLGSAAQWLAIRTFRFNALRILIPVRDELDLRRTNEGKAKVKREKLEKYTVALLTAVYVLYSAVWLRLIGFNFLDLLFTLWSTLKGIKL